MKRSLLCVGYLLALSISMLAWFFSFVGCVVCMPSGYGLELKVIPLGAVMIASFYFFVFQVALAYDSLMNVLRGKDSWYKHAVDWNPITVYLYKLPQAMWGYCQKRIADDTALLRKV